MGLLLGGGLNGKEGSSSPKATPRRTRMPPSTHLLLSHLLLALVVCLAASIETDHEGGDHSDATMSTSGNAYLLSFGLNQGDIRTLISHKPVKGVLRAGAEARVLQFAVQEVNGSLPDVLLAVNATGGSGDVDLYCVPLKSLAVGGQPAGPHHNVWWSNDTVGADYVFISREHVDYRVINVTVANGARVVAGAAFSCAGNVGWQQTCGVSSAERPPTASIVRRARDSCVFFAHGSGFTA